MTGPAVQSPHQLGDKKENPFCANLASAASTFATLALSVRTAETAFFSLQTPLSVTASVGVIPVPATATEDAAVPRGNFMAC